MKLSENLYFYPEKGFLDCNTYVIKGSPGVIVDPGSSEYLDSLVDDLRRDGIDPKDIGIIVNTHLHLDHSWGDEAFKQLYGARITLHPLQKKFYDVTIGETSRLFGIQPPVIEEDGYLDEDRLDVGKMKYRLIPSPGHSPDSICFYCSEDKVLICGDVVFDHNTGRVDLPAGNAAQLVESINKLAELEIEYLLPGHMDFIAGSAKVKENFEYIKRFVLEWL